MEVLVARLGTDVPLGHGCPARHTAAWRREGEAPSCHQVDAGVDRFAGGPGGCAETDERPGVKGERSA
eukprot:9290096-Lingulodinium_polyedra.AAC.1